MFLIIDNYDSFTYNIAHALEEGGARVRVERSDQIGLADVEAMAPKAIVISSGSGRPGGAGLSVAVVRQFAGRIPIVGIGLGLLCVAEGFGARIVPTALPMHGKQETIDHDGRGLFAGLPSPLRVVRYDSLLAAEPLPEELVVTATAPGGEVMALRHRTWPVEAVQYHPASALSEGVAAWVANVVRWAKEHALHDEENGAAVARGGQAEGVSMG